MTMNPLKQSVTVRLDALKVETDAEGDLITTAHLELPSGSDLQLFRLAHSLNKKPSRGRIGTFQLRVIEEDGTARTIRFPESRGSKTKDFKFVAVLEKYHEAGELEPLFKPDGLELILDVEVVSPEQPVLADPAAEFMGAMAEMVGDGITSVTLSSGGTTVTIDEKNAEQLRKRAKA